MVSAQQHPATARSPRAGDFGAAFVERLATARPWGRWWEARQPGRPVLRVPSGLGTCRYMREFGFVIPERPVVVDDVRVRGTGRSGLRLEDVAKAQTGPPRVDKVGGSASAHLPHPQGRGAGRGRAGRPRREPDPGSALSTPLLR